MFPSIEEYPRAYAYVCSVFINPATTIDMVNNILDTVAFINEQMQLPRIVKAFDKRNGPHRQYREYNRVNSVTCSLLELARLQR